MVAPYGRSLRVAQAPPATCGAPCPVHDFLGALRARTGRHVERVRICLHVPILKISRTRARLAA